MDRTPSAVETTHRSGSSTLKTGLNREPSWESSVSVPLFRCSHCGFVTTASEKNARIAHEVGAPQCAGKLELVVDFRMTPILPPRPRRRRRSSSVVRIEAPVAPADAPAVPPAPAA
jgi:hypothetical protein